MVNGEDQEPATRTGWGAIDLFDGAIAEKDARRSWLVWLLKLLLPVLAVGLVATVILWHQFEGVMTGFNLSTLKGMWAESDMLQMLNPNFITVDDENQVLTVSAARAMQGSHTDTRIILDEPRADLEMKNGTWLALIANSGIFDREDSTVFLEGSVSVFHENGFELSASQAWVDLKTETAWGDVPVRGHGPNGEFQGEGFKIADRGQKLILKGRSRVMFLAAETPP